MGIMANQTETVIVYLFARLPLACVLSDHAPKPRNQGLLLEALNLKPLSDMKHAASATSLRAISTVKRRGNSSVKAQKLHQKHCKTKGLTQIRRVESEAKISTFGFC